MQAWTDPLLLAAILAEGDRPRFLRWWTAKYKNRGSVGV